MKRLTKNLRCENVNFVALANTQHGDVTTNKSDYKIEHIYM